MSEQTEVVRKFYTATQTGDGGAILAILHPEFEAQVAPGLPCVTGDAVRGPRAALAGIWGPVFEEFDTAPYDESWHETGDGLIVVTGHYRGTARATGRAYEAEFVHLWRVTDGRISHLHQYTDTERWHAALRPGAA
ncbi:nuclear transport factor 2 family protein [Amycolatopsis anabasis]|uniref:nuclear transport factor 2 family protein n=1 Tax=Amycolatopsis anabasis TaxID=1840409 RepID=UPI00131C3658|nr:nuclear transport factor 2 family protein [Amycolatopsis anabasis]